MWWSQKNSLAVARWLYFEFTHFAFLRALPRAYHRPPASIRRWWSTAERAAVLCERIQFVPVSRWTTRAAAKRDNIFQSRRGAASLVDDDQPIFFECFRSVSLRRCMIVPSRSRDPLCLVCWPLSPPEGPSEQVCRGLGKKIRHPPALPSQASVGRLLPSAEIDLLAVGQQPERWLNTKSTCHPTDPSEVVPALNLQERFGDGIVIKCC